jgi:hypothetical protein
MRRGPRGNRAVLVDTNLLLVLLVGTLEPGQIERFKRTKAYTREDFELLVAFVSGFERLLTTPNVLTEVSNFLGQLSEPLRRRALLSLGALAGQVSEIYLESKVLATEPHFPSLGLTDSSIIGTVNEDVTIVTDDLPLYHRLSVAGAEVINFNHLRSGAWG